ncbi:MAG: hypothetical protein Q8N89_07400 [Azonexus sp.]|nr:hypothetical protein [Azonexus sp.]
MNLNMHAHAHLAKPDIATMVHDGLLDGFTLRELPKGHLLLIPESPHNQVLMIRSGRLRV